MDIRAAQVNARSACDLRSTLSRRIDRTRADPLADAQARFAMNTRRDDKGSVWGIGDEKTVANAI
jgi:hypothetical protein